ncbi:PREDICTED: histone-lysine N-methyltransferase SETMAR-like [Habropoda laboriosa]|uniref:histone-lysine N-methyltransferase SETMAR-like n=1 Tax=Habropoda laboriosa TaxID=597456 RepID=UPI00083D45FB|nr:PREDICTED: histone-lysine N-methyltransferase SETMAR-like [Habropoda laboriosa]
MEKKQIRTILLYEFKLGRKAAETGRNINHVFGESTTSERTVQHWFKIFRDGDESLEDKEGRGRPSAIDNDVLKAYVEDDPCTTVRELVENLNVSKTIVSNHLKEIGKSEKLDKWIPHELNEGQKSRRFEICSALLKRNESEPFLHRIITCDEKWILYDNRRRSAQWLDYDQAPKHFPIPKLHQKKVMVTVWWSRANNNETVTSEKYCKELEEMHKKLFVIQPSLVNRKGLQDA